MTVASRLPSRWTGKGEANSRLAAMAGVLETPPLKADSAGPLIFASIDTQDILPFLLSAKSMRYQLGRGKFAIMDRGTLTGEDRALLAHHCGDPTILIARADNAPFPDTRWWDWVAPLVGRFHMEYRILLDLSRVSLDPSEMMLTAIDRNRGFVGPDTRGFIGIPAMCGGIAEANDLLLRLPAGCLGASDAPLRLMRDMVRQGTGFAQLDEPEGVEVGTASIRRVIEMLRA